MGDPVTTAISVGGSLIGGLAGSQESGGGTREETRVSAPWEPQQPYLTYGFEQGKTATEQALANPVYQGQRVAGLTPLQQQMMNQAGGFAGTQFGRAGNVSDISMDLLPSGTAFASNAADIYGRTLIDPTQQIISNAGLYANNPYTQGMIDAASRDVTRNLLENQLPSLAMGSTATGNINSTRAGVQQAIAERGAADRLADISSNIRGQFFNTGLSQAQNQYNQNLQAQLQANAPLMQAFGQGLSGLGVGQNLAAGAFGMGTQAGGMQQTQDQAVINAEMQKFAEQRGVPLDILKQYMGIVGGNYGGISTGTSTAPTTGGGWEGALTGALGGGLGAYGLANRFNNTGRTFSTNEAANLMQNNAVPSWLNSSSFGSP